MHPNPGGVAVSAFTDLCTLKSRLGIDSSSSDAVLQQVLDGAERAAVVFLGWNPASAAATEYYSGEGTEFLVLRRKPVTAVASVYEDAGGRYGQSDDPFPSETLLTEGEDYSVKIDGAGQTGVLVRHGAFWPYRHRRPVGRLGFEVSPEFGSVRVTYSAGYTPAQLADVAEAIYAMAGTLYQQRFGLGVPQSESLGGRSLSFAGPAVGASELLYGPSVNAAALALLRPHRITPVA